MKPTGSGLTRTFKATQVPLKGGNDEKCTYAMHHGRQARKELR